MFFLILSFSRILILVVKNWINFTFLKNYSTENTTFVMIYKQSLQLNLLVLKKI